MAQALDAAGKVIQAGDNATIVATIVSIAGTGSSAQVTVRFDGSKTTAVVPAQDIKSATRSL